MNQTQVVPSAYVPGVCNINHAEIAYRRKAGYVGFAVYVVVAVALIAFGANRWIRLVLFIPAFIAAIGYLQVKNKFCVSYAASGQQNANEDSKAAVKILEASAHAADKRRARTMNLQAAGIALILTALMLAVPQFN